MVKVTALRFWPNGRSPIPGYCQPVIPGLWVNLHPDADSLDNISELAEDATPKHRLQFRSLCNLPYDLELDTAVYYVDDFVNPDISGYTRLDMRLGWQVNDRLNISLNAKNVLDHYHVEYGKDSGASAAKIKRSIMGKISWFF